MPNHPKILVARVESLIKKNKRFNNTNLIEITVIVISEYIIYIYIHIHHQYHHLSEGNV